MKQLGQLFEELKRRNVIRVAIAYVIVAWLIAQVTELALDSFAAPDWVMKTVLFLLVIGFPLALILAWAYELTPEGIKLEKDIVRSDSVTHLTGRKLDFSIIALLAIALIVVILDNYVWIDADPLDGLVDVSEPVPGFSNRAAIAVLPFVNLSNDPEQEYFADGITEDLITALQSFQSFPIIARTSTFTYKNISRDVRDIASELGAGYIVEGSVRKVDDLVRINVQLNNDQGNHVWADVYTFQSRDALRIQDELVSNVILAIEPQLIITEADRARFVRTEDMEAWDYFLQAATNTYAPFAFTDLNGQYVSPERLELAREFLFKALEIDPNFAAAYRLLNHIDGSYVVNLRHLLTDEQAEETRRRAIEYGDKARLISPFEPSVCSCQAAMLLMSGDVEAAFQLQQESLRHNPSNAVARAVMAKILQVRGENELALQEIALAKRLSPRDMAMTSFLYFEAAAYLALGRFDKAIKASDQSLLLVPGNYDSRFVRILSLFASDQREEAKAELGRLRELVSPELMPTTGWNEPFPTAVAAHVTLESGRSLMGVDYNEGLHAILHELGWNSP